MFSKSLFKKTIVCVCTLLIVLSIGTVNIFADKSASDISMHRLYNPNSGEHFYTGSENEKTALVNLGWKYEGIGWLAPVTSDYPVYRLYNPNEGEHHFTMSSVERDNLVTAGWKYEGIGFYSADPNSSSSYKLYREYNPNAYANNHNYTLSLAEHRMLVGLGWRDEGVGWYATSDFSKPVDDTSNKNKKSSDYVTVENIIMKNPGVSVTKGDKIEFVVEATFTYKPSSITLSFKSVDNSNSTKSVAYIISSKTSDNKYTVSLDITENMYPGKWVIDAYTASDIYGDTVKNDDLDATNLWFTVSDNPTYKVSSAITLPIQVRSGAGTNYEHVKYSDLSTTVQKEVRKNSKGYAYVQANDTFIVYETKNDSRGNVWARIDTAAWVCVKYEGTTFAYKITND